MWVKIVVGAVDISRNFEKNISHDRDSTFWVGLVPFKIFWHNIGRILSVSFGKWTYF